MKFDTDNLAQAELAALMGYEGDKTTNYPNFRKTLHQVAEHAHAGLILYMTDALQDYLCMEQSLKKLTDFMRLTDPEKSRFDAIFRGIRAVRKDFVVTQLKEVVDEVIKAHENDTDSEYDSDKDGVEILKSIKL